MKDVIGRKWRQGTPYGQRICKQTFPKKKTDEIRKVEFGENHPWHYEVGPKTRYNLGEITPITRVK